MSNRRNQKINLDKITKPIAIVGDTNFPYNLGTNSISEIAIEFAANDKRIPLIIPNSTTGEYEHLTKRPNIHQNTGMMFQPEPLEDLLSEFDFVLQERNGDLNGIGLRPIRSDIIAKINSSLRDPADRKVVTTAIQYSHSKRGYVWIASTDVAIRKTVDSLRQSNNVRVQTIGPWRVKEGGIADSYMPRAGIDGLIGDRTLGKIDAYAKRDRGSDLVLVGVNGKYQHNNNCTSALVLLDIIRRSDAPTESDFVVNIPVNFGKDNAQQGIRAIANPDELPIILSGVNGYSQTLNVGRISWAYDAKFNKNPMKSIGKL